jgi:hypothetical protein
VQGRNRFRKPLDVRVDDGAAAVRLARLAEDRFATETFADGGSAIVRIELDVMVEQPTDRADALRSALDLVEDWLVAEQEVVDVTLDGRRYTMRAADFRFATAAPAVQ